MPARKTGCFSSWGAGKLRGPAHPAPDRINPNPFPMLNALAHLNALAVLGTAVIGFLLGWLWYSPVLFAKPWMAEMKLTPDSMKGMGGGAMAQMFATGFAYTLLSTLALAALLRAHGSAGALKGAEFGLFVGVLLVGTRLLNGGLWEQRTRKLQAITVGHEVALFTLQGAILAVWN